MIQKKIEREKERETKGEEKVRLGYWMQRKWRCYKKKRRNRKKQRRKGKEKVSLGYYREWKKEQQEKANNVERN